MIKLCVLLCLIDLTALSLIGVKADSPLAIYSEWPVSGTSWRMNAWCNIHLTEDYTPQAAQQGFRIKVILENHATGAIEVFYPFDGSATTVASEGGQTVITLTTQSGIWVYYGTINTNFLIDFYNEIEEFGNWPQGSCSGPLPLDMSPVFDSTTTPTTSSTTPTPTKTTVSTTFSTVVHVKTETTTSSISGTTTTSNDPNADICAGTMSHTGSKYNYEEVLCKSILFYEAQRSGDLDEATNRVRWRKDSALGDGGDVGLDLTGGWFDAGDYVKFNFPMAVSTSFLAWGLNQWTSAYVISGQYNYMLQSIKWPLDYFLKCWRATQDVLYAQVGDGDLDHDYIGRPEDMTMARPALAVTASNPGTDLAAETAAAFAAGSIAFKINNPSYSDTLLANAKTLFDFAYHNNKGKYNEAINSGNFYSSNNYWDELAWAAAMLFSATNNQSYITLAKQIHDSHNLYAAYAWSFDWDSKQLGSAILIFEHTRDATIQGHVQTFFTNWINGQHQGNVVTPGGLVWRLEWGSLRHAANVAFAALMAADVGVWDDTQADMIRQWAKGQIDYMLGDNPRYSSYVVGFGNNPPKQPHHRASFCSPAPAPCTLNEFNDVSKDNYYVLYGALVGGPDQNDNYSDLRTDYQKNEVACDYNAGFQSALAGIIDWKINQK